MSDEQIVQPEDSVEPTTEVSGETPQEAKAPEPDKFAELEKKLMATLEEKERHWQGVKDREVGAAKREAGTYRKKAEQLEAILEPLKQHPQFRQSVTQAEANLYRRREQQDLEEQAKQEFFGTLEDHVRELGLDVNNPEIDWGKDATDIKEANKRFHKSLAKIQKAQATTAEERILAKIREEMAADKAAQRKEDGIDSVDTTIPAGVVSSKRDPHGAYARGEISREEYVKLIQK